MLASTFGQGLPDIPVGLEKKANDVLNAIVVQVATYQAAYGPVHGGRLWQGILTHPVRPKDGNETAPDKTQKPKDQSEDWGAIALPAAMPIAIEVHVHNGGARSELWGYTIIAHIGVGSKHWSKSVGIGFGSVSKDWAELMEVHP